MSWVATAIVATTAVVAGTGYSIYSGEKQRKEIKKQQSAAEEQNRKALAEAELAQATAESQAKERLKDKRRRIAADQTTFTGPMGLAGQADMTRKTLLGA